MAGPHQQGAPGRSVGRPRTASVTAIVIDTSALMAERERHGIAATEVEQLLLELRVGLMPLEQHQLPWALQGSTPRRLLQLRAGPGLESPLLFKGSDFAATDVAAALAS